MGATAGIAMTVTGAPPSSLNLLKQPPEAWKVFADKMLERTLSCYSDGQIDWATALHWVRASSKGCSDKDRLRVLTDLVTKLPDIKPHSLKRRKPLYPEPLKKAIAELVSVLASKGLKVTPNSNSADVSTLALPIVKSWIEQSGLLRKVNVPSEKSLYNWYLKYPYTPPFGTQK